MASTAEAHPETQRKERAGMVTGMVAITMDPQIRCFVRILCLKAMPPLEALAVFELQPHTHEQTEGEDRTSSLDEGDIFALGV
eukprot:CAMPEP_0173108148 /NCGR_PEP_ID=MMETSP1102-20130122/42460_1 /TAXON_ID=49646 /ORGANISM="Geminigera sp., Strain Caron Lab Isolate" /LENGTH=82 /DNA_ID=CAMNT_0014006393 /DNA_START=130 /DNA_END=379 /DNA_ORIENTATION=-